MFSAVAGSGVDICSFSVLSLLFRVSEKVKLRAKQLYFPHEM